MINISEDNFVIYCIVFSSICHLLDFGTHFIFCEGEKWSRGEKSMAMAIMVAIETKAEQIYTKNYGRHHVYGAPAVNNHNNNKHIQQKNTYNKNTMRAAEKRETADEGGTREKISVKKGA